MERRYRPVAPTSTAVPSTRTPPGQAVPEELSKSTPQPPGQAVPKELSKSTPQPPGQAVPKELSKSTPQPPGQAVPKELSKSTPQVLTRDRRQAGPDRHSVRCSPGRAGPARNRLGSGCAQAPRQRAFSARRGRRRVA